MKIARFLFLLTVAICPLLNPRTHAAELTGTVHAVNGDTVAVTIAGDLVPNAGDQALIFFKLAEGDDEISVATGSVVKVEGDSVQLKIWNATGEVEKDQLVRITCEKPEKRNAITAATPTLSESAVAQSSETATTQNSEEAARLFQEGYAKFRAKDFDGAIAAYTKSIELNPNQSAAYVSRGGAYNALKQSERALADFNESIRLDPNGPVAYVNRGNCYADLHQLQRAIEDYNEAIRIDPKHADAYNNRASVYSALGQTKIAIEDLNKSIELNPTYEAVANRAALYKFFGKTQLAKRDFARAQELKAGTSGASTTSSSASEPAAMPVDRGKAAPNAAPQGTDLVNPAQKLVGTWQGTRHRKQYFADGIFVTDPHLVPNPPRTQWRVEGDRLTEYYSGAGSNITLRILSIDNRELVTTDDQGHTFRAKRISDAQAAREKANW